MSDPLDDLLRSPDDDGRPYDEMYADMPADVAALVFAAARACCERELAQALERADGNAAKVIGYRLLLQRAPVVAVTHSGFGGRGVDLREHVDADAPAEP